MFMKRDFESFLLANLPASTSFHPVYEQAIQSALRAGGKRFRPLLILSVVEALNPLLKEAAMHAGIAIEFMHTYSLIHDDLPAMDDAPLRRGQPTIHEAFDEVTAILAGDALNTYAFEVLSNAPLSAEVRIALVKSLSGNAGLNGMVLGQAIDCFFENKPLEVDAVKFMHVHKTAKLIASALEMGAIIAGVSKTFQSTLYDFGIKLGLLFQIQDDILDEIETSEEAGKPTHNDADKNSFINILGLEESIAQANALAQELEAELNAFEEGLKTSLSNLLFKYLYRHNKE